MDRRPFHAWKGCPDSGQAKIIGVDLEATLCTTIRKGMLIQIATESASICRLILFGAKDLSLYTPFSHQCPNIRKVFHGRIMISVPCTGTFGSSREPLRIHSWPVIFWASGERPGSHCCEVGSMWS